MSGRAPGARRALLASLAVAFAVTIFVDPIPQPQAYHDFADRRAWLGVPNAADVASNLPFLFVGIAGTAAVARRRTRLAAGERASWTVFFGGVAATAFGSAWYHLDPHNASLVWDRIPIAVACTGLLAAVVSERIDARFGRALLWPFCVYAVGSVLYWDWSEAAGRGDLRWYGLAQFLPLAVILGVLVGSPARHGRGSAWWWALGFYAAAKLCEWLDAPIHSATGLVSGHTLKHLFAAAAPGVLLRMLMHRSPLDAAGSAPPEPASSA